MPLIRGPRQSAAALIHTARPFIAGLCLLAALLLSGVSPASALTAPAGGVAYRSHVFPVQGPHWLRGPIGGFGAPRSGGRVHEGYDIVAACGTDLVAVRSGRVVRSGYDPVLYGNFLLIHGAGEARSYFYSHLRGPALVDRGDRLWAGQRVGAVGMTGNARTVGCHLHFEIRERGVPIDLPQSCGAGTATADLTPRTASTSRSGR